MRKDNTHQSCFSPTLSTLYLSFNLNTTWLSQRINYFTCFLVGQYATFSQLNLPRILPINYTQYAIFHFFPKSPKVFSPFCRYIISLVEKWLELNPIENQGQMHNQADYPQPATLIFISFNYTWEIGVNIFLVPIIRR